MSEPVAVILGASWCSDSQRVIQFFEQQGVPYRYVDIECDPKAVDLVLWLNHGRRIASTAGRHGIIGSGLRPASRLWRRMDVIA